MMRRPLFLPTARQTNWLLIVGFLALGEAMYLRYMAIENVPVSLACRAGLDTWLCSTFRQSIVLYEHEVFGAVALVAAVLNLMRPSIVLVTLALAAAAFGVVLHNADSGGAGRRHSHSELGTSRARARASMTANAIKPPQNHTACQFAKLSLNTI